METTYQTLFRQAPVSLFILSGEGAILDMNEKAEAITHQLSGQLANTPFADLVPEEDKAAFQAFLSSVIGSEKRTVLHAQIRSGKGLYEPVRYEGWTGPEGNVCYLSVFAVSEGARIQRKLEETEKMLHAIADHTYDWEYWRADDGKILYCSPSCKNITGYDPAEFLNDAGLIHSVIHPEDRKRYKEHSHSHREDASGEELLVRIIKKDSTIRWISHSCHEVFDEFGKSLGRRASNRDVTRRMAVEEQLAESEEKFNAIFKYSPASLVISVPVTGTILDVNDTFCRDMGYAKEEAVGRSALELGLFYYAHERLALIDELNQNRFVFGREYTFRSKSGEPILGLVSIVWIKIKGEPVQITIAVDIREKRRIQEEITKGLEKRVRERTLELETVNKELEKFTYTVSHDLRAPLRAINGFANIMKEEYSKVLDEEGSRLLGVISDSASRMSMLMDDLLTFSRVGRHETRCAMVDVNPMVTRIFRELSGRYPSIPFTFNKAELPEAYADPSLILLVWNHLISNALKFSQSIPAPVITIEGEADGREVHYVIRDNGVGFNMQYVEKIFDIFQSLHHHHEFEGTGVGLAIVHRIVTLHGGRIWAEGEEGRGAAFHFTLPYHP